MRKVGSSALRPSALVAAKPFPLWTERIRYGFDEQGSSGVGYGG
jgi:hypothetical protein